MDRWNNLGFLIVTLNYNISIVGKIWFTSMILLRMSIVVLAGYPLYQDEQERFICNTLQPGCTNVCYDVFSPVSHFRFWLAQVLCVLLTHVLFGVYVLSEAAEQLMTAEITPTKMVPSTLTGSFINVDKREIPDFSRACIVHLLLRTIMEAGFAVGQYYLFGFFVPKNFSCFEPPCTSSIECYISRPTEKSFMMIFMWVISGVSLLLSTVDLIYVIHKRARVGKGRHTFQMMENDSAKDGRCSTGLRQAIFSESPEGGRQHHTSQHHDLQRKRENPASEYSPSFRSDEDEVLSVEFEVSPQDTAKSNINSNSNQNTYSFQVSLTPPASGMTDLCKAMPTNTQSRCGEQEYSEDPGLKLGDTAKKMSPSMHSNGSTSGYVRAKKSDWV